MRAQEHYQAGELREAVAAAIEEVKQKPGDFSARVYLVEMLCIAGELDRADKHLDAAGTQDPKAIPGLEVLRRVVRAEQARQDFHASGAVPEFLGQPTPALRLLLEASIATREGKPDEAARLLARAEELRPSVRGTCDGKAFDDLRDLDDLNAPIVEVYTGAGKYYWVPFESIELIEFHPPGRPRDLLWRKAHLVVRDGPDGEVYVPALYAGSHKEAEDRVRLGRVTEWQGGDGAPVRGLGQRIWLVGEEARPILEIGTITFDPPAETAPAPAATAADEPAGAPDVA